MPDELIIRHCSPTLAGLKTGNLFAVEFDDIDELRNDIRDLNKRLSAKGLRVLPMRYLNQRALLYFYRPSLLKNDLASHDAESLLRERGYIAKSPEQCIVTLINRIRSTGEFPHEIGLFLGYPPEDVRGFIENKAENYKTVGTWKVYGDADRAEKLFCQYRRCTNTYFKQYGKGKSIEQLTVAV